MRKPKTSRKVPKRREKKRKRKRTEQGLRSGQVIRVRHGGKTINAVFLRNIERTGEIVVDLREYHPRKITKAKREEIDHLEMRAIKLAKQYDFLWEQWKEQRKADPRLKPPRFTPEGEAILEAEENVKNRLKVLRRGSSTVRITRTVRLPLDAVVLVREEKPTGKKVSKTERRRQKKKSLKAKKPIPKKVSDIARRRQQRRDLIRRALTFKSRAKGLKFLGRRGIKPKKREIKELNE
jgi:hypothetical protein